MKFNKIVNGDGLNESIDMHVAYRTSEPRKEEKAAARGQALHVVLDEPATPASVAAAVLAAFGRD
ncbi:MAG: hypothetical protein AB7I79_23265 [Rhizobiaceae bacterium]